MYVELGEIDDGNGGDARATFGLQTLAIECKTDHGASLAHMRRQAQSYSQKGFGWSTSDGAGLPRADMVAFTAPNAQRHPWWGATVREGWIVGCGALEYSDTGIRLLTPYNKTLTLMSTRGKVPE